MTLPPNERILDYNITTKRKPECISDIIEWIKGNENKKYFVCANSHSLGAAQSDHLFKNAIKNADLITPDGIGILLASKIMGGYLSGRITGSDIFLGLSEIINKNGKFSYFFLGSNESTLDKILQKMVTKFPNIRIAGTYSPPFKAEFNDEDNQIMINKINNAKPDVLWVGMTAPKQEKWIYQNIKHLDVKFVGAIGAVFDFFSDNIERPPAWVMDHGLEWLHRTLKQPRRLWRRVFITTPIFFISILKQRFRNNKI